MLTTHSIRLFSGTFVAVDSGSGAERGHRTPALAAQAGILLKEHKTYYRNDMFFMKS